MNVLINNEPIDITIENERTIGDVIDGLEDWLVGANLTITGVAINRTPVEANDTKQWRARAIDTIETLSVDALDRNIIRLRNLEFVIEHLANLKTALSEEDTQQSKNNIFNTLAHLSDYLEDALDNDGRALVATLVTTLPMDRIARGIMPDPTEREQIVTQLTQIEFLLGGRLRELKEPHQEMASTVTLITLMLPTISKSAVLLQTGKDREVMESIARFSELLTKLLRIYLGLNRTDQPSMKQSVEALNATLRELLEALEGSDAVLIGDLLEYEIVPGVQKLLRSFEEPKK